MPILKKKKKKKNLPKIPNNFPLLSHDFFFFFWLNINGSLDKNGAKSLQKQLDRITQSNKIII